MIINNNSKQAKSRLRPPCYFVDSFFEFWPFKHYIERMATIPFKQIQAKRVRVVEYRSQIIEYFVDEANKQPSKNWTVLKKLKKNVPIQKSLLKGIPEFSVNINGVNVPVVKKVNKNTCVCYGKPFEYEDNIKEAIGIIK